MEMGNNKIEIEYTEGCVAFIDILGFKELVKQDDNITIVRELFDQLNGYKSLFDPIDGLKPKVAIFSDSVVVTIRESDPTGLVFPIWMAEEILNEKTGLLFRGGIAKGKYYHEGSVAFGPAINKAYELEQKAKHSRIVIQNNIFDESEDHEYFYMKDSDGEYCLNPYSFGIVKYAKNCSKTTKEELLKALKDDRCRIIKGIDDNYYSEYIEKYTWRVKPFNILVEGIEEFFKAFKIDYTKEEIESLKDLQISLPEIEKEREINKIVYKKTEKDD